MTEKLRISVCRPRGKSQSPGTDMASVNMKLYKEHC